MSNLTICFFSFIILLSCLSEKIEIIVHNEEVLLTLCFIAFVFFAYSFLSNGFAEDSQQKTEDLKTKLFSVISKRCNFTLQLFSSSYSYKSLESKMPVVESLVGFKASLFVSFFSSILVVETLKDWTVSKLTDFIRLNNLIVETSRQQKTQSFLISLILPVNYFSSTDGYLYTSNNSNKTPRSWISKVNAIHLNV